MLSKLKLKSLQPALTFGLILVISLALAFSAKTIWAVWNDPACGPTGCNTDTPINVGSVAQTKIAPLIINLPGNTTVGERDALFLNSDTGTPWVAGVINNDWLALWSTVGVGHFSDLHIRKLFTDGGGVSTFDGTVAAGDVEASRFCLGNGINCVSSWPGGSVTSISAGSGLTASPADPITTSGTLNVGAGTGISVLADTVGLAFPTKSCGIEQAIRSFDVGAATAPACITPLTSITGIAPISVSGAGGNRDISLFPCALNQIYKWNGASWACAADDAGGGGLSGGSANKVAYWTSASTLSNNTNFHWDNTNTRLGIGTSSPNTRLELASNLSGLPAEVLRLTNTDGGFALNSGAGMSFYYQGTVKRLASINAAIEQGFNGNFGYLAFGTRTSDIAGVEEKMRITSSGNVQIAATNTNSNGGYLEIGNTARASSGISITTSSTGTGFIDFSDFAGAAQGVIEYIHQYDALRFQVFPGVPILYRDGSLGIGGGFSVGNEPIRERLDVTGNIYASGYIQPGHVGTPAAVDCDTNAERGRMAVDVNTNRLYVCNGAVRGWDFIPLTN